MDSRRIVTATPSCRAIVCLAAAGAGLMALAAPVRAQNAVVKFPLRIAYNLCQGWIVDAREFPERTTREQARQKCIEMKARVMSPPTGADQALPTTPLTAVEAQAWCEAARYRAWYLGDDV